MASSPSPDCHDPSSNIENEEDTGLRMIYKRHKYMLSVLPRGKGWISEHLFQYQGFWLHANAGLESVLLIQDRFKARPTDVFLASIPKTGITWLKALTFAIINRGRYDFSTHPLRMQNPHGFFPFLEMYLSEDERAIANLEAFPSPRLLSTHIPYTLLPSSMTTSSCRFVYIWRDVKDVLVSTWLFMNKLRPKELDPLSLQEAFELFCQGISPYGPYWDHVLGYWIASLEKPAGQILLLKYEDLQREPLDAVKRLAEFLGKPFLREEEKEGVPQQVVSLCSFENLSNLEVNKTSAQKFSSKLTIDNRHFFRKGKVGDWKNHLSPEMADRLEQITKEKLIDAGLTSA